MKKFVPVIVAANPFQSFSGDENPIMSTLKAVGDRSKYHEPVLVTHAKWLNDVIGMAGEKAGNVTFISAPDAGSEMSLAAIGSTIADMDCNGEPILLMDSRVDRSKFSDHPRDVSRSIPDVNAGYAVAFTSKGLAPSIAPVLYIEEKYFGISTKVAGLNSDTVERGPKDETASGDYACSFETISDIFDEAAPGIMDYASKAFACSTTKLNVISACDVPYLQKGPHSFQAAILANTDNLRAIRLMTGPLPGFYTPWNGTRGNHGNTHNLAKRSVEAGLVSRYP